MDAPPLRDTRQTIPPRRAPARSRRWRCGVRGIIKSVRDVHVSRLVLPLAGWLLPGASDRA